MNDFPNELDERAPISEWLKAKDPRAIDELLTWCRPLLRELAQTNLTEPLAHRVDASDVVQETCKDLAQSLDSVNATNRKQFWVYIRLVLLNNLRDLGRRHLSAQKRSLASEKPLMLEKVSFERWLIDSELQPIEKLIEDERLHRVLHAFSQLPREVQKVVRWRFRKKMTWAAIGLKIGRSEDDIRMYISRCFEKIRRDLESI